MGRGHSKAWRSALLSWLLSAGCAAESAQTPKVASATFAAEAPHDVGPLCLDIDRELRVCFHASAEDRACAEGTCLVPRPSAKAAPGELFRCYGAGRARRCEARSNRAGPFHCDGERCIQALPRVPDAAEWVCVEMHGVSYCKSSGPAAAVAPGARDPGFVCGARRGAAQETICVDFNPDPPPGLARYACRMQYTRGMAERVCSASTAPRVGQACAAAGACPDGTRCVDARCLPARPDPSCWLDADCETGRCRFGTCVEDG